MFFQNDLMGSLQLNLLRILNTGNIILDTVIGYLLFQFASSLLNLNFTSFFEYIKEYYYGNDYSEIILEGKQMDFLSKYSECAITSGIYSDTYRAIFKYITKNIFEENTVNYIRKKDVAFFLMKMIRYVLMRCML